MDITFGQPSGQQKDSQSGGGLFKKTEKPDQGKDIEEMSNILKDMLRRVRILEERHGNIRRIIQVNEQNAIGDSKKFHSELKSINTEATELKKMIREMGEELKLIVAELKECVKKDEMKVLEHYIEMWDPMQFVSHREVEGMVRRIIKEEADKTSKKEAKDR